MGIQLPGWLRWVGDLIGEPFPEGDETACRRQAERWRHYADELERHKDPLSGATQTTLSGFTAGDIHNALGDRLKPLPDNIDTIAGQLRQMAEAVDNVATEIEFAKEMFIANLVALAATLVALAASAWINWGAPAEGAAAVAAAEFAVSQIIRAAVAKVAEEGVARVIAQLTLRALGSGLLNAAIAGGMNAGIQGQQMLQGHRRDFDSTSFWNDVESGGISGAVMGPLIKGGKGIDAGSALGNRFKNAGVGFVANAGGTLAAQQAVTGHMDFTQAAQTGAVFGGVDGLRRPEVHRTGGPEIGAPQGDRPLDLGLKPPPADPLILPTEQQRTAAVEPSPTAAGHSGDGPGAPAAKVDVPFGLESHTPGTETAVPAGSTAIEPPGAAPHTATPVNGPHPGSVSDAPSTGPAPNTPAPTGTPTGHASAPPQAPTRAGLSEPAAAGPAAQSAGTAAARSSEGATHPVRDGGSPVREVQPPRDSQPTRDSPPPRDAPPPREAEPPRETPPPRDTQQARDAQPTRDRQPPRDGQPPRDNPARDGQPRSTTEPEATRRETERADSEHRPDAAAPHDATVLPPVVVTPVPSDIDHGAPRSAGMVRADDANRSVGLHDSRNGPPPRQPAAAAARAGEGGGPPGGGDPPGIGSHPGDGGHHPERDPGERWRDVTSYPNDKHSRGLANQAANQALWKRIPPVRPEEVRHHLADNAFGEQRAKDNAVWWRGLSGEEQRALIDSYPREIGNADGIPASARHAANHSELSRLRDELQSRKNAGERLTRGERKELRRYDELGRVLDAATLKATALGGQVRVLAFDPNAFGGDGRMVVSVGADPSRADAVSWHVPGYTTTIDSLETNLANAMNHLQSVRMENPDARVASIAWIGYDAPQGFFKGLWDVTHTKLALAGGDILHGDLAAFNAARDAIAGDGSHFSANDVFGHSYGSTTTSYAGHGGRLADHARSITLAGSPGAGPLHHAAEFKVSDGVFVASSSRDPVTMFGGRTLDSMGRFFGRGLGIDPAMHAFGAIRVTAEFPRSMDSLGSFSTHTAYYDFVDPKLQVRTESLANFGRIGAGRFDEVYTEAHRTERPWWSGWPRTDEPAEGRPLRLDPTGDGPYSVERRIWDPRWHSEHPESVEAHHDDGRCAHDVGAFLADRYGRDFRVEGAPGPTGVPARNLFQACGSASHFATYADVHQALLRHGDGSAAVLASRWSGGPLQGGHAYVAVNEGSVVHLYEKVGERFERSGWPPTWGEQAVEKIAVGYLDRHGQPVDPLDGHRGQLAAAEAVGDVAGKDPVDEAPSGPPHRDYDVNGHTIPTNELTHPQAHLLDESLLDNAIANPNRVSDALAPGAPATHPEVQDMVPHNYDPHGGLSAAAWNREYWPTGQSDAHGNPELVWPDPETHPQGFSNPEQRTPGVLNPGQRFDRFGPGFGMFGSPVGTSFPERALPPHSLNAGYHRYEVLRPIPVWEGPIASAMEQPGGGTQYYFTHSIVDLVNAGYLREIPL